MSTFYLSIIPCSHVLSLLGRCPLVQACSGLTLTPALLCAQDAYQNHSDLSIALT